VCSTDVPCGQRKGVEGSLSSAQAFHDEGLLVIAQRADNERNRAKYDFGQYYGCPCTRPHKATKPVEQPP